jgi:PhnB protein
MAKKTKRTAKRPRLAQKLSPIPPGMRTVTPYLFIAGAAQALEFYKRAFGAKEISRQPTPDGKLIHAMMKIGDSFVMLSDAFEESSTRSPTSVGALTSMLHVYTKDVDKLWNQALAAGAKVAMPLDDVFWGERYGQLEDPFGHRWTLSMRIPMSREEREAKQKAAMAMFAHGEHPGAEPQSR